MLHWVTSRELFQHQLCFGSATFITPRSREPRTERETCRQGGEEKERAHQQALQQLLEHRNQNLSMPEKNKRLFLRKMKRGSQYPSCWSLPSKVLARSLRFDKYPRDKTRLAAEPKEEKPLRGKLNHLPKWGRRKGRADTQEHLSPCPSDCRSSRAHWHGPAQIPVQSPLTPSSAAPGRSPHPHCRQPHLTRGFIPPQSHHCSTRSTSLPREARHAHVGAAPGLPTEQCPLLVPCTEVTVAAGAEGPSQLRWAQPDTLGHSILHSSIPNLP